MGARAEPPSTAALTNIPRSSGTKLSKTSEVLIDLSKGIDAPGKLQVTTSYLGRRADQERESLADDNPQERQSHYANYIADYYPGAKLSAPLEINDDREHNIVKVTEHYDLPQTFKVKNGRKRFFLQADELYRYAESLKSSVRSTPLAIAFPANVRQTIQVMLPKKWDVQNETVHVDNPAFHYTSSVEYREDGPSPRLVLDYQYRSLTDTIEVAALEQYLQDRRKMDDDLGFYIMEPLPPTQGRKTYIMQLKKPVTLAAQPKWMLLWVLLAGGFVVWRRGYPWNPAPKFVDPTWPVGIRGWLIPVAVLTVLSPLSWPLTLWMNAGNLDVGTWDHLSGTTRSVLFAFGVVGMLVQAALILNAWLLLTKRSSTPAVYIWTNCVAATWAFALQIYEAINHLLGQLTVADVIKNNWTALPVLAVFVAYFSLSKRVQATFVNRYQPRGTLNRATMAA